MGDPEGASGFRSAQTLAVAGHLVNKPADKRSLLSFSLSILQINLFKKKIVDVTKICNLRFS